MIQHDYEPVDDVRAIPPCVGDLGLTRPAKQSSSPHWPMIGISLFFFFAIVVGYGTALDGGVIMSRITTTWFGYLFVAGIILIRRRNSMTRIDLAFIGFGYPLFLLLTEPFVSGR